MVFSRAYGILLRRLLFQAVITMIVKYKSLYYIVKNPSPSMMALRLAYVVL